MITGDPNPLPEAPPLDVVPPTEVDATPDPINLRCEWCFKFHVGAQCWSIQKIEWHDNGNLKALTLLPRPGLEASSLDTLPTL